VSRGRYTLNAKPVRGPNRRQRATGISVCRIAVRGGPTTGADQAGRGRLLAVAVGAAAGKGKLIWATHWRNGEVKVTASRELKRVKGWTHACWIYNAANSSGDREGVRNRQLRMWSTNFSMPVYPSIFRGFALSTIAPIAHDTFMGRTATSITGRNSK